MLSQAYMCGDVVGRSILSKMRWNNKSKACIVDEALKSVPILSMGVPFYIMPVSSAQIHL